VGVKQLCLDIIFRASVAFPFSAYPSIMALQDTEFLTTSPIKNRPRLLEHTALAVGVKDRRGDIDELIHSSVESERMDLSARTERPGVSAGRQHGDKRDRVGPLPASSPCIRTTASIADAGNPFRAYPATSAFQETRSLAGMQSNTLRASAGRRHLKYMLARAVAARDSEARPRAGRGEVGARRAGLEERREGAEDWARGHGGGGGGGGG
jgi:hypothetical protein